MHMGDDWRNIQWYFHTNVAIFCDLKKQRGVLIITMTYSCSSENLGGHVWKVCVSVRGNGLWKQTLKLNNIFIRGMFLFFPSSKYLFTLQYVHIFSWNALPTVTPSVQLLLDKKTGCGVGHDNTGKKRIWFYMPVAKNNAHSEAKLYSHKLLLHKLYKALKIQIKNRLLFFCHCGRLNVQPTPVTSHPTFHEVNCHP